MRTKPVAARIERRQDRDGDRHESRRRSSFRVRPDVRDRRNRARRPAPARRRRLRGRCRVDRGDRRAPCPAARSRSRCVQSFTYTFAFERASGERAPRDPAAREVRALPGRPAVLPDDRRPRRRDLRRGDRLARLPPVRAAPGTKGGLWTYRRLVDAAALPRAAARDITMFNWPGNDYRDQSILDAPARSAPRAAGRKARQPRLPALAADRGARTATRSARPSCGCGPTSWARADGLVEASLHPRGAPHPSRSDGRRAGRVGGVPARPAGGATSPTRSASAGTRSTSTAPARTTSASARAPGRSRSRSAR